MALEITIEDSEKGALVNYWRVSHSHFYRVVEGKKIETKDDETGEITISIEREALWKATAVVSGYLSKDLREAGASPQIVKSYDYDLDVGADFNSEYFETARQYFMQKYSDFCVSDPDTYKSEYTDDKGSEYTYFDITDIQFDNNSSTITAAARFYLNETKFNEFFNYGVERTFPISEVKNSEAEPVGNAVFNYATAWLYEKIKLESEFVGATFE